MERRVDRLRSATTASATTTSASANSAWNSRPTAPAASATQTYNLPILEDANAIQLSLTQIMRQLAGGQIDHKTAGLMLYSLQIATSNLPQTTFEPPTNSVRLNWAPDSPAAQTEEA